MAKTGEIHAKKHRRIYEDTCAEWRIAEFLSVAEKRNSHCYESPTFSVAGVPFFFELYPRNTYHPESVSLYLKCNMCREFSVEYKFGLKKLDGSVEHLKSGTMEGKEMYCKERAYVVLSEVTQRKTELVTGNVLTVTCTVVLDTTYSTEAADLDKLNSLKLIRLDTLSENFKDLFDDKETCDTTLKVKDKEYKAHRSVLIARSSVFASTFKHDMLEKQTGVITIPDCDPYSFQQFLEYLYCGKLEELSCRSALNLYYTSDKYDVKELKTFCTEYLIQSLTVEDVCEVAVFSDKYDETELYSAVQDFFNTNVHEIVDTSGWDDLLTQNRRLANKLLKAMPRAKQ